MKNLHLLLTIILIFFSCSNDENNSFFEKQYLFHDDTYVLKLKFYENTSATIDIFKNGVCVYQNLYTVKYIGEFPSILLNSHDRYDNTELEMQCSFSSFDCFTGTVLQNNLSYKNIITGEYESCPIPSTMDFSVYKGVLDMNGDAILDIWPMD